MLLSEKSKKSILEKNASISQLRIGADLVKNNIEKSEELIPESLGLLSHTIVELEKISKSITNQAATLNLLALNAAIEAARAKEYGHGFRQVAEDLRTWAERAKYSVNKFERDFLKLRNQYEKVCETYGISPNLEVSVSEETQMKSKGESSGNQSNTQKSILRKVLRLF